MIPEASRSYFHKKTRAKGQIRIAQIQWATSETVYYRIKGTKRYYYVPTDRFLREWELC